MLNRISVYLATLTLILTTSTLEAGRTSWLAGTTNLNDASNWSDGVATGSKVGVFDNTGNPNPTTTAPFTPSGLEFENPTQTYTFTLNHEMALSSDGIVNLSTTPQIFNCNALVAFGDGSPLGDSTITYNFSPPGSVEFNGTLEGTASFNMGEASTLLSGSGQVQVGTFNTTTGTVDIGSNTFTINTDTDCSIGGPIIGTGTLLCIGNHKLTLSGDSADFSGTTIVNGQLVVNGNLGGTGLSDTIVPATGSLLGTGTLGMVVVNGGAIAPGNSIGTLNLATYTNNGGDYYVEVDASNSDLINVSADAIIDGGFVFLIPIDGKYTVKSPYTIIQAETVTGQYTAALLQSPSTFPLIKPELTYDSEHVYLTINTAIDRAAVGCNQLAIAQQLDGIVSPDPDQTIFLNEITSLSLSDASAALDALSGQQHTNNLFMTEIINRQFIRRLYDPLRPIVTTQHADICCEDLCCNDFSSWIEGSAGKMYFNGHHNNKDFNIGGYEITAGVHKTFCRDWTLGFAASYEYDRLHYKNCGTGKSKTWLLGLYSLYRPSCYYGLFDIAYGNSTNSLNRPFNLGSSNYNAHSHPKLSQCTVYGEVGLDWDVNCLLIQPFGGIEIGTTWRQRIRENEKNAGGLQLTVNSKNQTAVYSRLGLHITTEQLLCNFSISADLAWIKRLTSCHNNINEQFTLFGDPFTIEGNSLDANCLDYALTISTDICNHWKIYAQGYGEVWNHAYTYNLLGGLEFGW